MKDVLKAIEAVWKIESTRLIAAIARVTHDIGIRRRTGPGRPGDYARTQARRRHDILRLIFTACHPVVTVEARIALTLRLIFGLTTAETARACLVPDKTMGQRIFRAKKTLSGSHVPFETPSGNELRRRVESVLLYVYLIFNEGYTATSGEEWVRAALSEEALRLGRMLAQLLPDESEVHALLALME
jgi:predicted RNA polymerase sigma factor